MSRLKLFFLTLLVLQVSGCTSPATRMNEQASTLGYQRQIVRGDGFDHVAYLNRKPALGNAAPNNAVLHVYLEGDGTPWLRNNLAASDPTPRKPMMLNLMAQDTQPSLYLGRPCYHGFSHVIGCTPDLWTTARYSEKVVASMAAALGEMAANYQHIILLGYSGGGSLAMLLAERLPQTKAVVTLAANLDTAAWAALHEDQLSQSLNPATRPPLPAHIKQMHYAGGEDDNVPPDLIRNAIARQPKPGFKVFEKFDHRCCWQDAWHEVLGWLARAK
ncbi:MAG: hypothetical protein ABL858_01780 [Candidatus Nitrotoga sp.]